MNIKTVVVFGALTAFAGAMQAAPLDYVFGGLGNLGASVHTFSPTGGSGPSITAYGFTISSGDATAVNLYSKGSNIFPTTSNDENGLGLVNDSTGDHEVTIGSFIMLDMDSLSIGSLYTGSTTQGEEWEVWGSDTAAQAGQSFAIPSSASAGVLTGFGEGAQDVSSLAGDRYVFLTTLEGNFTPDSNVLLGGVTATSAVPEPASAGLLGLALLGASFLFRKRLSKKA